MRGWDYWNPIYDRIRTCPHEWVSKTEERTFRNEGRSDTRTQLVSTCQKCHCTALREPKAAKTPA